MDHFFEQGLVHVYTGDGKGKTTAALGLALRALGWGAKVSMIQFIKGYSDIGELKFALESPGKFELNQFAIDYSRDVKEEKVLARREAIDAAMKYAETVIFEGQFDLVILDEINNAVHYGLVDPRLLIDIIRKKPRHVELALTGRNARREIMDAADYVTEMHGLRHPFEAGIPARQGIDY